MSAIFRVKRLKPHYLTLRARFSCQRKLAETQSVRQLRGISVNLIRRKIQLTWAFCLGLQTTAAEEELYTENFSRFE